MDLLYWKYGLTLREVGAVFGMGYHSVRDRFDIYGIHTRKPGARLYEHRPATVKQALSMWDKGITLEAIAAATAIDLAILVLIVRSRGPGVAVRRASGAGSQA